MVEPPIAEDLWGLICDEYVFGANDYPAGPALTKEHVKALCRSIAVPEEFQEKFRSRKFKQNPLTDMKRYVEKWISIRARLGGDKPEPLMDHMIYMLRIKFLALDRIWEQYRHRPGCDAGLRAVKKCHKSPSRCRKNFPNYNYIILTLMHHLHAGVARDYLPYLPQIKTRAKLSALDAVVQDMFKHYGWAFTPMKVILEHD
jgi:hypothetical protein